MEFTPYGSKLKKDLESYVHEGITNKTKYSEAVSLASAFIGLLVARCTTKENRDHVLGLISKHIAVYENESRSNLEDFQLMIRHIKHGPPPNPVSGKQ